MKPLILEIMKAASFPETVKDNAERLRADLVCVECDFNRAFGNRKGLMSREEAEAVGLLGKKHCSEVSVSETNLAVLGNGAEGCRRTEVRYR